MRRRAGQLLQKHPAPRTPKTAEIFRALRRLPAYLPEKAMCSRPGCAQQGWNRALAGLVPAVLAAADAGGSSVDGPAVSKDGPAVMSDGPPVILFFVSLKRTRDFSRERFGSHTSRNVYSLRRASHESEKMMKILLPSCRGFTNCLPILRTP